MVKWHDKVEDMVVKMLEDDWEVTPSRKKRNYVLIGKANREKTLFNPDVVVKSKDGNRFVEIIEISETSPSRPVDFLGLIQAADLSLWAIREKNEESVPDGFRMIFLIKDSKRAEKFEYLLELAQKNLDFLKGKVDIYHIRAPNEVRDIDIRP